MTLASEAINRLAFIIHVMPSGPIADPEHVGDLIDGRAWFQFAQFLRGFSEASNLGVLSALECVHVMLSVEMRIIVHGGASKFNRGFVALSKIALRMCE